MYLIDNVAFIAHPNTGSRSLKAALKEVGVTEVGLHHSMNLPVMFECRAIVSTLRNPWDLMASWYWRIDSRAKPFDEWLAFVLQGPRHYEGQQPGGLFYGRHWSTHYIKFEEYQSSIDRVTEDLGLPRLKIPHEGKSKNRPTKDYTSLYSEYSRELVIRAYREQIRIGQYNYGE